LERQPFDLVLMDVQMPEMDGFEATARIRPREQGTGRHIPIVAMTAHAMKGDRERCLEAGMDGYVSKPIQARELLRAIEQLVPEAVGMAPEAQGERPRGDGRDQPVTGSEGPPEAQAPVGLDGAALLARVGGRK